MTYQRGNTLMPMNTPPADTAKRFTALLSTLLLSFTATIPTAIAQESRNENSTNTGPGSLALILDSSDSMAQADVTGGTRMDAAKSALHDVVNGLNEDQQVTLLAYGSRESSAPDNKAKGCQDVSVLAPLGSANKDKLNSDINSLQPRGYTPIGTALRRAADELGTNGKRSIILVSDGEDTCAPPAACDVAKDLSGAGVDLSVHTVGFRVNNTAKQQLECIARETGGTYSPADSTETLRQSIRDVAQRTSGNYGAQGTELQLSDSQDSGLYVGQGLYRTTMPSTGKDTTGSTKWFRISAPEKSYIMVSAIPIMNQATGDSPTISMSYTNPSCDDEHDTYGQSYRHPSPPETAIVTIAPDDECNPGEYRIGLQGKGLEEDTPVEILVGVEPVAEGAAAGPENTRAEANEDDVTALSFSTPTPTSGGDSYTNAVPITAGQTISDTLVPGETKYYKMPVEWGQRLLAMAEFEGRQSPSNRKAQLFIANPRRINKPDSTFNGEYLKENEKVRLRNAVPEYAFYRDREDMNWLIDNPGNGYLGGKSADFAGDWYVALTMDGGDDNNKQSVEEKFILTAGTEGQQVDGPAWRFSNDNGPQPSTSPIDTSSGEASSEDSTNANESTSQDKTANPQTRNSATTKDNEETNWALYGSIIAVALVILGAVTYFGLIRPTRHR